MNNHIQEENQNYNYQYQASGSQDIQYPKQMSGENNAEERLPPIYNQPIESIKETSEEQVKYFEPIELSSDIDVKKYLSSGKLMKQLAPKIMQLKQQTQKEGMTNDPSVHTEINFDLKQNDAIYDGPEGNNEEQENDDEDIKKSQNLEQSGPGGIKYSSVLPAKYAKMKIVTIDQYGNKKEEGGDEDNMDELENKEVNLQEQNNFIAKQKNIDMQKEQLRAQEEQQLLLQKQLEQEKLQLQQQIERETLRQQQIIQEQKMKEEQLRQQKIFQEQKMKEEQLRQQQFIQQQKMKEEQMKQQQLIQQQKMLFQQQNIIQDKRPSVPIQNSYPYIKAYSGNIGVNNLNQNTLNRLPSNIRTVKLNDQNNTNNINYNQKKKDPIVQKAIKIYGSLRQRIPQIPQIPPIPSSSSSNSSAAPMPLSKEIMSIKLIQNNWRNHFIHNRFNQIKPQLIIENNNFLKQQYDLCDKAGPIAPDADFNPEGWKRFYPIQDDFFNFDKGFVISCGVKIRHPNDPTKVSVYEGDVNLNNERHGFGRLTTIKSVYLGQWRNNQFTGWGRETRRTGKIYEGKYINGLIQGKGILKSNNGTTYVGDFLDSKRHGKGMLDTHKLNYEGDFKNDKLSGKGRITFKLEGHVYEGEFDNNEINGYGTFKWNNGDSYTGYMLNGKMHGKGTYRYNNGNVYEGMYNNGIKQGKGKVYNINDSNMNESQKKINQNNNSQKINISRVTNTSKNSGNK